MPKSVLYRKVFAKQSTGTSGAITGSGTTGRLAKFTASGAIGNSVVFSETDGAADYVTLIHNASVSNATSIRGSGGNVRMDMGNNSNHRFFVSTDNHVAATSHLYIDNLELYFAGGDSTGVSNAFFGGGTDFMYFDVNNQQNVDGQSQIFLKPTETQINTLPLKIGAVGNGLTTTMTGPGATNVTYSLIVHDNTGLSNSFVIRDDTKAIFNNASFIHNLNISGTQGLPTTKNDGIFSIQSDATTSALRFGVLTSDGGWIQSGATNVDAAQSLKIQPIGGVGRVMFFIDSQVNNCAFDIDASRVSGATVYGAYLKTNQSNGLVIEHNASSSSSTNKYGLQLLVTGAGSSVDHMHGLSISNTSGADENIGLQISVSGAVSSNYAAKILSGKVSMASLQIGNAGLSTDDLYKDTAANILSAGDYVVGMKV